jgi:hypothetical protein
MAREIIPECRATSVGISMLVFNPLTPAALALGGGHCALPNRRTSHDFFLSVS